MLEDPYIYSVLNVLPCMVVLIKVREILIRVCYTCHLLVYYIMRYLGLGYSALRNDSDSAAQLTGNANSRIVLTACAKCYPGKTSRGHKQPNEVCAEEYLNKEIEAVGPELLILVGGHAIEYVTGRKQLEAISRNDNEHKEVNGKQVRVISLTHPSGANGSKYNPKYKFKETIALIQDEIEKYC